MAVFRASPSGGGYCSSARSGLHPGTRFLSACLPLCAARSPPAGWGSFFKSRDGVGILSMVAGPRRQSPEAHGPQFPAERLLTDRDVELLMEPLHQIDEPPADHAMYRRHRATLDDLRQLSAPLVGEDRDLARRLAVYKARRTLGIEPQNPIAKRLKPDTTDLGGMASRSSVIDLRKRQ